MRSIPSVPGPLCIFVDAGVVIDGCTNAWGASKAVLILATRQEYFTIVLCELIDREIQGALARKTVQLTAAGARDYLAAYEGWLDRVRVQHVPAPSQPTIMHYTSLVLPVLRHLNDLRAVISAIEAKPDWVLSTNTAHWSPALGARTGLRIAHPWHLLDYLCTTRT